MKLIYVTGDCFAALEFEKVYGGQKVSDLIENIKDVKKKLRNKCDIEVKEVGEVDSRFVSFIKNTLQDYDQSKENNFYMENEVVGTNGDYDEIEEEDDFDGEEDILFDSDMDLDDDDDY